MRRATLVLAGVLAASVSIGYAQRPAMVDAALSVRDFERADILIQRDEPEGWREFRTRKAGSEILNEGPQRASLECDGKIWSVVNPRFPIVMVYENAADSPYRGRDLRYLGLDRLRSSPAHSFSTETDGNSVTVTCVVGDTNCVYVFDTAQGNSLVRSERRSRYGVIRTEIVNAQYGGFWFPQTINVTRNGQWMNTITVLSARFERDDMPDCLDPSVLNVGLGTNVIRATRVGNAGYELGSIESYDGTQIVPMKTAWQMRRSGDYPEETWGRPYPLLPMDFSLLEDDED